QTKAVSPVAPTDAQLLTYNAASSKWVASSFSGDATVSAGGNVVVKQLQAVPLSSVAPTEAQYLAYNSVTGAWVAASFSGDATVSSGGNVILKSIGTAGSYVSVMTDGQGRVTAGLTTISAAGLPTLSDTKFWVGNGGSDAVAVAASGDVTMNDAGSFTV